MNLNNWKITLFNSYMFKHISYLLYWAKIIDQGSPQILPYMLMIIFFYSFNIIRSFLHASVW